MDFSEDDTATSNAWTIKAAAIVRDKEISREVDHHIGQRLRVRRQQLEISQTCLGTHVGIAFQHIQKYESGANRVSASTLFRLANFLKVPVTFFFDGLDSDSLRPPLDPSSGVRRRSNYAASAEGLRLLDIFTRLPSRQKADVLRLIDGLVEPVALRSRRQDDNPAV